ncbi:hypothetical protein I3842_08G147300, partial [Carya illinoinensis]
LPTRARVNEVISISVSDECPMCNQAEENTLHLFIKCPIARILWSQSSWPLNLEALPISSISDWIKMIISPHAELGLQASEIHSFQLFAAISLDFIWKQRNDIVHNQLQFNIEEAKIQLNHIYLNYKDSWNTKQKDKQAIWQPPPPNFLSYSFDVAIRDTFSTLLSIQTDKIQSQNPLVAETTTTLLATKMAASSKHTQVIFEGDSQLVLSAISDQSSALNWYISNIIKDIQHLYASNSLWSFVKIHRSVNRCTHSVAQWAATNLVFGSIPLNGSFHFFLFDPSSTL